MSHFLGAKSGHPKWHVTRSKDNVRSHFGSSWHCFFIAGIHILALTYSTKSSAAALAMDGGRVIPFATVLEELLNSEGRFSLAQASGPVAKAGGGDLSRNKGGSRCRLNSSWPVEAACPLAKAAAATTAPPLLAKLEMIKEAEEQPVEAACGGAAAAA